MSSAQPNPASAIILPSNNSSRPCIQEVWIAGEPHLVFTGPESTLTLNRAQARLLRSHQAYLDAFLTTHDAPSPSPSPVWPPASPTQPIGRTPRRKGPRARENYGVSRIDQPQKSNHGWYVRVTRGGRTIQKFFSDKKFESRDGALNAARQHRDAVLASLEASADTRAAEA